MGSFIQTDRLQVRYSNVVAASRRAYDSVMDTDTGAKARTDLPFPLLR